MYIVVLMGPVHVNHIVKYHMLVSNDGVYDVACLCHECIRTSVFMHYHLIHILALLQKCSIEAAPLIKRDKIGHF